MADIISKIGFFGDIVNIERNALFGSLSFCTFRSMLKVVLSSPYMNTDFKTHAVQTDDSTTTTT